MYQHNILSQSYFTIKFNISVFNNSFMNNYSQGNNCKNVFFYCFIWLFTQELCDHLASFKSCRILKCQKRELNVIIFKLVNKLSINKIEKSIRLSCTWVSCIIQCQYVFTVVYIFYQPLINKKCIFLLSKCTYQRWNNNGSCITLNTQYSLLMATLWTTKGQIIDP